jgi:hypothetical protein
LGAGTNSAQRNVALTRLRSPIANVQHHFGLAFQELCVFFTPAIQTITPPLEKPVYRVGEQSSFNGRLTMKRILVAPAVAHA